VPLDPCHLTPAASLNRALLAWDDSATGPATDVTANSLLSAAALGEMITRFRSILRIDSANGALADELNVCLDSPDEPIQAVAERIATSYGYRLGRLLAMLRSGDPASRAARVDWDDSYWDHWATISRVCLGGGLASGRLGELIAKSAEAVLSRSASGSSCAVAVAAYAPLLPLIGAARSVPDGAGSALVLDIGHTKVRYAMADYQDGALISLRQLTSVRAPEADTSPSAPGGALGVAKALADLVAAAFAGNARHPIPGDVIVAAIATYMDGGQPLPAPSGRYSQLRIISADLSQWLSQQVSQQLRRPVTVRLMHDGSSAARAIPADPGTAVIMLGTSLGVGYPCPGLALRPVSPALRVSAY